MQTWPTLYKTDTTGKIRQWTISVDVEDNIPFYEVEHGVKDGAMVGTKTFFKQGKNIGRANETTPYQQAVSEAESEWNKKKNRKGYSETVSAQKEFSPMLAKSYNKPGNNLLDLKDGKHVKFPCYYQPKLDGIRCIANNSSGNIQLKSRQQKLFTSLAHLEQALSSLNLNDNIYLDGELYVHGEEFQNLTSAIKRDDPSPESAKVEYHIYDVYDSNNPAWPYGLRKQWLERNIVGHDKLKLVEAHLVENSWEIQHYLHQQIQNGYEGIMLRNVGGLYKEGGRSKDLQKVKLFIDQEFPIVDAFENKGKMAGQCTLVCETDEGHRFGVKPEGTEVIREQYWTDWKKGILKGKLLTVRFFSWTSSKNSVPRFPVGIAIRDYE